MTKVNLPDRTLEKMNRAMEAAFVPSQRGYLGASMIGQPCARRIWYSFHWLDEERIAAKGLKAIADGHHSEAVMTQRLQATKGVTLFTHAEDGQQFSFRDGHTSGHLDGRIWGVSPMPGAECVWEHKCVNEKKFNKLLALCAENEADALEKWDIVYYAQAQVYMYHYGLEHHYLTVCTPGSRDETSCITAYNPAAAEYYAKTRPAEIVAAIKPPPRISENPAWFECKFCPWAEHCHGVKLPAVNCRTCAYSTPEPSGVWTCALYDGNELTEPEQRVGCAKHLYNPGVVPGVQTDAGDDWIEYKLPDGTRIRNKDAKVEVLS